MIGVLKKHLPSLAARLKLPNFNADKKFRGRVVAFIYNLSQRLNRILIRLEIAIFSNFAIHFMLSILQPELLWSLVNMKYSMAIIEPSTSYTKGTLALAVLCFFVYLFFIAFAFYAVISNFKYLLKSEESLQPHRMKFYRNLFDDFNSKNKLQLLFVPLSMLRNLSYTMTLALLNSSSLTQMIIIIWSVTAIFIAYYIAKQPLKDKWTRRITLVSELFCFGCMTIGLIVGIIEKTVEIDPTTRNEIGFAFIAFAIISTLAGGLFTRIQVLELLVAFYKYIRDKLKRRRQVKPISLAD